MEAVVKVDERGTLILPDEFRQKLGLEKGGQVILDDAGDGIRLRSGLTVPVEVYSEDRIREFEAEEAKLKAFDI